MLGEELLRVVLRDRGVDDDVFSGLPVDGRGDLVLVGQLESYENSISVVHTEERYTKRTVNSADDLVEVAARGGRVGEREADHLLGVDHKDSADGEREALLVNVRRILVVKHVVERRYLAVGIRDLRRYDSVWDRCNDK